MSHNWQERQEQTVELPEEENTYPHVHNQQTQNHLVHMSKCEVAELTWENGQLAMHRLGSSIPSEHRWERASDTLESIVHQATCHNQDHNLMGNEESQSKIKKETIGGGGVVKKRMRSDSDPQLYGTSARLISLGESSKNMIDEHAQLKTCESVDNDTTLMTWPNYSLDESSRSFKSKPTCHAGSENKEDGRETKGSNSLRRSRTAAVHNQSERRRRDRINEKMKALQKLVPNASKTNKASMLDEVIKYLKQLQAQIQLISHARNMESQMMMPPLPTLGLMQPHIQMPLLARMGMGVNLGMTPGMLNNMTANLAPAAAAAAAAATTPHQSLTAPFIYPTSIATSVPSFMSPAFAMAPTIPTPPQPNGDANASRAAVAPSATHSFPFNDPRSAFLAQSMNMEFNNQLAAQYMQQANNQSMQTRNKNLNQGNLNQRQTE